MLVFSAPDFDNHEQVTFCYDAPTNLKAIIAIHNTTRGPTLGGCRMWNYASEEEALKDVLRLSRGMTYKAALANLPFGGGKAVILGDAKTEKTPEKIKAFARFIERLKGLYITSEDVGTYSNDMDLIHSQTSYVVGIPEKHGGSGNPAPMTAFGIYSVMRFCVAEVLSKSDLGGVRVAIQGLGNVGMNLAKLLFQAGAHLIVTDIHSALVEQAVKNFSATAVHPDDIYSVDAEIFAPCALGGIINDHTINQFHCQIIAGSANNQLAEQRHGDALQKCNILYAPDYLINAGGLINVSYEGPTYNRDIVLKHIAGLAYTMEEILNKAKELGISTSAAADQIAESRFPKH